MCVWQSLASAECAETPPLANISVAAKAAYLANQNLTKIWSSVYIFSDGAQGITAIGVITDPGDETKELKGLLAVDYQLVSISNFLIEAFADTDMVRNRAYLAA